MSIKRRTFIRIGAIAAATGLNSCTTDDQRKADAPTTKSMTEGTAPITATERAARVGKAQRLLAENNMQALLLDCGTSLDYFTGVRWWPSERTMVAIIPVRGEVKYVCPAFEEDRLREQITIGKEVFP